MNRRTLTFTLGVEVEHEVLEALEDWPGSSSEPPCPGWELLADRIGDECVRLIFAELLRIGGNPALLVHRWHLEQPTRIVNLDEVL